MEAITDKVMIIGAGFMGNGIAQVCAQSGFSVRLVDVSEEALRAAQRTITLSLEKLFARGRLAEHPPSILERIHFGRDVGPADQMQWIIEAVVEEISVKKILLRELDRRVPPEVPLATNTSSIPITALAAELQHPQRMLGLHFFGPVPLMQLVEVVRGEKTSPAVFERGVEFVGRLGKTAVRVNRDLPGFVMNRIFGAAFRECLELVAAGIASVEDIDAGMRLGYGWNIGPFEIADNAGIDTFLRVSRTFGKLDQPHLAANTDLLADMVKEGRLGRKAGWGFYRYGPNGKKI